jgi:hypothetical protein
MKYFPSVAKRAGGLKLALKLLKRKAEAEHITI